MVSRARSWLVRGLIVGVILLVGVLPAAADNTPQPLPFAQDWANTGLITANDNWSGVAGVEGYLGQDITTATGADPQTLLTQSSVANDLDVIANQSNPNIANGGVGEFDGIADPVVALQGSGTADAPYLLLHLNTTGHPSVRVAYNLRDIDGSADNAVQQVALQYRVGSTGNFTNLPAGYVADATSGPSLATLVTPVSVILPAAAGDQPLVQVRVITTNAPASDEWVGVDDISVTAEAGDDAPAVQTTVPADGATGVAVDADVSITFSELVDVAGSWFSISCGTSGTHTAAVSGGPSAFTLDPDTDFAAGETCNVTIVAANVTDQDTNDPPDAMADDHVFGFTTAAAAATGVVVSEIYGGGGNSGATLTHDFIELYNTTAAPISLAGWSVQYASATGTSWQVTPLTGSIAPGRNYLVQEAAGAGGTTPLPVPDAIGAIPMSATAGKVALVSTTAALTGSCPSGGSIVDFVGYGATASCFEGSGPTPAPSNTTSVSRIGGGATDTNNNAADFTAGTPDPHAAEKAPGVSSTTPSNGATGVALDANVTIAFSEPVDVTGSWFSIACATSGAHAATATGGPTTFALDPDVNFASNESCTVTVLAANVTDQDTDDPPDAMAADHVFSFQTADVFVCGDPATFIHDVQGSGTASPVAGTTATIEGVVVGDYQGAGGFSGYYVQEEDADADADPATSEGIFVFNTSFPVAAGDLVRVRGTVAEFPAPAGLTQLASVNAVAVCSSGTSVTSTTVSLPVTNIADHEQTEGMLVSFAQTLTATEVFTLGRFGEVSLSGVGRLYIPTAITTPGAAAIAQLAENNRSRIILDDGNGQQNIDPTLYPQGGLSASNTLRVGDTLPSLTGVMDFRFGNYRIQPVGPISFDHTNPRPAAPEPVGGNLEVASFNVLNYFNGDGLGGGFPTPRGANTPFEFDRQRDKIISAITAIDADIVGLMEIENDATGNSAIEDLVAGLNAAVGAGTYAFVDTGVIGTDEIKVALIYKPAAVSPVGAFQIITSAVDPRFDDSLNRPSLAQTFEKSSNGGRLTVVVSHLKSKGSDCNHVGDPDTGDGQGNCNLTRTRAAAALVDWLATDPTGSGDPDFLLIGDMNAYTFEDPITTFTNGGFTNLVSQFGGLEPYSFVFNGESGYLDHALASPSLAPQSTGTTDWHINPDEPIVLDYNVEFKTPGQVVSFYDPGPYRASDHDPMIVGLDLNGPPTVAVAPGGTCSSPTGGGTMNLEVGDAETPAGELTLSASSSNPALVPNGNVVLGGSGADRTVAIAPISSGGTAIITITVSDGTLSATTTITVIVGTNGVNALEGTGGADLILGLNGDDVVAAGSGNDLVCGGSGVDVLEGGADHDTLEGANGNDMLRGEDGDDILRGENGGDTLTGGAGADAFSGGSGSDTATDLTPGEGDTTDGTIP